MTTLLPHPARVLRAIVETAYDTDGTVAIRFGSGAPIRRANRSRSPSVGAKKSSGAIACGKRLARSPSIPARSAASGSGPMYAQFR